MTKRAAVYCRISKDAEQKGLGVERQEEDCRALAERKGWPVHRVYRDNDVSASRSTPRPEYEALMQDVRDGVVSAIVVWDVDRLTRKPRELEDVIDLADQRGVELASVGGEIDLATPQGRGMARLKGVFARMEVENQAGRLRRAFLQKAQRGDVQNGARSFGWAEDKVALHPAEAPALRRAVEDVIDGVPTREVARRWNEAGLTTVPRRVRGEDGDWLRGEDGEHVLRGTPWNHTSVRAVLRNPRLAGWRVHQRAEKVAAWRKEAAQAEAAGAQAPPRPGWKALLARDAEGRPVRGAWEPLVDEETFEALQAALDGRRPRARAGGQRYMLSGVARCGECSSRMHGTRTREGHAYACSSEERGHSVTVAGRQTDDLLAALVEARLASEDLSAEPLAAPEWEGEARLRAIPGLRAEAMRAFKAGEAPGSVTWPLIAELEAEQAALEAARPRAAPAPRVASPEDFASLDVDRRRAVVESLVEAVVVAKAPHRGARWTPDRLEVVWR